MFSPPSPAGHIFQVYHGRQASIHCHCSWSFPESSSLWLSEPLTLPGRLSCLTALLPSVGAADQVSVQDDADYIRNKMILPVLDYEERNVVLLMHSYSSAPGSAAASGLGREERGAQGKTTAVIGQICLAALLPRGGDGKDIVETFGGNYPPHIRPDVSKPACSSFRPIRDGRSADVAFSLQQICSVVTIGLVHFTKMCQQSWLGLLLSLQWRKG
jgi:hypothetical protein